MLSKVTFGVMDPIDVYNLLVKFFGVINCDERVLSEIFCSIYKNLNLFLLKEEMEKLSLRFWVYNICRDKKKSVCIYIKNKTKGQKTKRVKMSLKFRLL